jgi:uncharacterized Fe-S center protein/ribosomal protein S18 acetylase RimI-like enzyme
MKIYRTPTYLPTIDGNKKKGSVSVLLTPNYNSSKRVMQNPMFINKQRFQSYYLQKDVSYFVNSKVVEEATFNEGYSEYEYLVEMTAAEKNKLKDSDFGLPLLRKYPMPDAAHVRSAIKFFNYVDKKNEAELAKNIKKKAKEYGVDIKVGETNRLKNYVTESEIISESIHNNPAPVFFLKEITPENILAAYNAMAKSLPAPVACKVHSGEFGNNNFLRPDLWKPLIEYLNGTVVECNTAYKGSRNTTEEHKKTLAKHGWDKLPCEIMDEKGEVELDIPVYNQMNKNFVGAGLLNYNSMVVLSHFKGHAMGGFGGALKQLSIGCASSRGKKIIHGHGDEKRGTDLLNSHTGKDEDVDYKEQIEFTEAMADAASSVHNQFKDNIIYINVLANISKDCDCDAHAAVPSMKDIGILISNDPVAIDKASVDMIYNSDDPGKDEIIQRIESRQGLHIFDACKNINFGNPNYRLIDLSMLRNIEKNTEKRIDEEEIEESYRPKLYHLSKNDNLKTVRAEIPDNYFTKNGYEENKTERACFAPSINKCLMGLSRNCKGEELYVYTPDGEYDTYKPSKEEVPDSVVTGETWIKQDTKVKCIGKIKVVGDSGKDGHEFKYGDKKAELYDWDWKWLVKESFEYVDEHVSKKDEDYKSKGTIDLNSLRAIKLTPELVKKYRETYKFLKHIRLEDDCTARIFMREHGDEILCGLCVQEKSDGHKWIQALEVYHEFRGYGLGKQMLDYAVTKLGAEYLSVSKKNQIAIDMYTEYGFKLYKETQLMFFFTLNKDQKYEESKFTNDQAEKTDIDSDVDISTEQFLSEMGDVFSTGDTVFLFNEDATSLQLKKYLYADRIRQRKELLTLYSQVKIDNKDIKFTFPDIKKYMGKNLFFDTYYYTELFFRNNTWVLKKGLNLFAEYMNLLNTNISKEVSSYKKITYFIPVLDWSNGSAQPWNYKQRLSPISLIYQYMFTGDIRNLKKMFNNSDVVFIGDKNYFKLNFGEIDTKTIKKLAMKFKLFITKICLNQEFDPEDVDTTPDNMDSKEVITAKIVDKIEDAKGVDLTAAVAADKAMQKSADKSLADKNKYAASKDSIAKANKVEQELEQPTPDEVVSKGTLNQLKNSDDSKREKDISSIVQGINRVVDNTSDVDSALGVMDNDIDIKQAIIDLDSETNTGTINISASRAARITALDKKLLDTELNGRTIKEILDQKPAELPSISIPVASPNAQEWQNMNFVNFDKGYDIDKDIIRCFRFFENVSRPISIRNISSQDNSTSEDRVSLYTVELEDYTGKRFSIKLDIPIMKDNRFLLRGNSKTIQTQFFNMPILKVDEDVAEIISNYMKIRVIKYNTTPGKSLSITTRLLKALDKYKGRNIKVTNGDNSMICKKYDLPMDYVDIASVIDKIETPIVDFYFSQDEIREKFADKISPRSHQYPIGYNKKEGTVVYWSGIEEYSTITGLIIRWMIRSDKNFQEVFEGTMRPSSNTFTKCRLMNAEIPTIVVCAYHEGLRKTLDKANIGYVITDKITKEIRSDYDSDWIKFSDGYLAYHNTYEASLLLNGLKVCNTEDFSIGSIDNKDMYLSFLDNFGGRIKSDGLDNFYDCMIDPMTKDVLEFYKLPTDYVSILIYASNLLADNKFHKHTDTSTRRLRRYELIASYTYKVLSDAYSKYANECKHGKNGDMMVKQSAVIDKFLTDTITSDDSCINALRDIESTNAITTKGPSGMNKDRAYSLDKRTYDESMLNVLGMSTGFAANTGITRQATLNANVQGEKGYVKNIKGDTSKMNTASSLTATEALIPFGTTHDDPMRTAMSFIQTAKHQVRTEESDPPLVVNGFEEAMPYMSTDRFAFKAKSDGYIEEYVPDEYIILKYKDGTNEFINLKETIEKNSDGGYFVPLKLDAKNNIKAGMKVKEGDILAYDKYSYSSDVGESGNLAYNVGKLAKVAIINSDEGFEDSGIITEKMAKSLATRVVLKFDVILDKETRVISHLNVGDHIEAGQPLLVWQNPFEEEEANALIGSLAANSEEVSELGKRRLLSEVTGKVTGIKMFRTVDTNDLSPTLKKMVNDYEKPIKAIADKINNLQGIDKSIIDAHTTLPPVGKLKKAEDSVLIEYYVEYLDTVGIGDKVVYFAANKATEKSVIPEGKEPRSSFRPNEFIDAFISEVSIDKRIVTSTLINGGLNKLMIELDRSIKDILGIEYDDSTV